jgi:copper chaperone NosL
MLLVGCEDYARPAEPFWNKQPCAHCRMLVSDPRFAAQLVTHDHERLFFDDPGCLADYMRAHARAVERAWVHMDSAWISTDGARFSAGASSPMGYGFLPSPSGEHDFAAVCSAAQARRVQGAQ